MSEKIKWGYLKNPISFRNTLSSFLILVFKTSLGRKEEREGGNEDRKGKE